MDLGTPYYKSDIENPLIRTDSKKLTHRASTSGPAKRRTSLSVVQIDSIPANYSATFDYVMVFPMLGESKTEQSPYAQFVVCSMLNAGLEVFPYLSVQKDELLVLIRAPLEILRIFADKIGFNMKMNEDELQKALERGYPEKKISPVFINHEPAICPLTPYEHIYLPYKRENNESLYWNAHGYDNPFSKSVRLKLIYLLLRAAKEDGGCGLEISKMLHLKQMLAFFPLHDKSITKQIMDRCYEYNVAPWNFPYDDIRDYFGEKIALYNVFLGHYSQWLIFPAIVGFIFQIIVWNSGNFSNPVLPFYSLLICLWSIVMLEYWKQKESLQALYWGMTKFETLEQDRPEFKGIFIKSIINGEDITYFPPSKTALLVNFSRALVTCFIVFVILVVAGIYTFRFYLQGKSDTAPAASYIASILNTVQITILNIVYSIAAIQLTNNENQRTDTLYEDSLIVKMFVFQFINSYGSFFFIAFIAANLPAPPNSQSDVLGQCGYTNCMQPLGINLIIIFGTRLTLTNFLDIYLPYQAHISKIKKETEGVEGMVLSPAEEDYMLMNYDLMVESIKNYADTAIQYGFSVLFITALPIASLFSLFSIYVKAKLNVWKLTTFYQRPVPVGAQDLGTWQTIFAIISVASVPTNAALVCFTMDVLWQFSLTGRIWIFIGFQWVLISIQFIAEAMVGDESEIVTIQKERIEFINEKVIEKIADDDFEKTLDGRTEKVEEDTANEGGLLGCCDFAGKTKDQTLDTYPYMVEVLDYPHDAPVSNFPRALDKAHPAVAKQLHDMSHELYVTPILSALPSPLPAAPAMSAYPSMEQREF